LIDTRQSLDAVFEKPVCKKTKLWTTVAKQLTAVGGYTVSGQECDEKWRNLQATYKRNKEKKNSTGSETVNWEYFDMMDEVMGKKASTQPAATQLFSSLPLSVASPPQVSQITPGPSSAADPQESGTKAKCPVATKRSVKMAGWIETYRETQEKRQKMWEEQKALEEKKVDAINNLAAAISRLADRPEQ